VNWHFQAKTYKIFKNLCIIKINLTITTKFSTVIDHQVLFLGHSKTHPTNPRWRTAAIFEKTPYQKSVQAHATEVHKDLNDHNICVILH